MKQIPLPNGDVAIVDDEDYDFLMQFKWSKCGDYAARYISEKIRTGAESEAMHRTIMQPPAGVFVDHINGNKMDNRRCNLRFCNPSQNGQNRKPRFNGSSKYKGLTWHKANRCWVVQIKADGRIKYIGSFKDERDAALAYNEAARQHFGEFARLNVIE